MKYIEGGAEEAGCVFCNRLRGSDDVRSLILHRAAHVFVIMNLYPYNTGHVMIVPNAHVAGPEEADAPTVAGMAALLPPLLRALRRALDCQGFNIGINVGEIAGAGVASHLHQHVVPRWLGDANFMPLLASTTVIPEILPVTYAKLRAELTRDAAPDPAAAATLLVVTDPSGNVLLPGSGEARGLPAVVPDDRPVWRSAVAALKNLGLSAAVAGWAGGESAAEPAARPALWLTVDAVEPSGPHRRWLAAEDAAVRLPPGQANAVRRVAEMLRPN